jgi:phosphoribosylformylglycinamidine synthase
VLIYKGINALPDFRKKNLLTRIRKIDKSIVDISAEYVHFVDVKNISKKDEEKLKVILTYGSKFSGKRVGRTLLVVPRVGSISPWSSKATDIVLNCGVDNVKRLERGTIYYLTSSSKHVDKHVIADELYDRMTETILDNLEQAEVLFAESKPKPAREIDLKNAGQELLAKANRDWGLALSEADINYLYRSYKKLKRNPTDVELMMFAQINSEHCRHKIFNADWIVDGKTQPKSLFKMIKNTYEKNSKGILSAYSDNAAVLEGSVADLFLAGQTDKTYRYHKEPLHIVTKAETHNHPTAVAPHPGAATGSGGEIRDEGATGRGAKPKIALTGFSVSNLNLPGLEQPWEKNYGKPDRIVSPLDIMIEAPLGGAASNNEFGRPNLTGYFRTYEQEYVGEQWGYHKPIMIAGGLGMIREQYVNKKRLPVGAKIITLGGPAMLIGLGGGSGASMQAGESDEDLDFASVQRSNAELQRRAQEVITTCWSLDKNNPIITIHDVGAGGWSNALPELVNDSGLGAYFELRNLPNAEPGLSPMEIWSNETQERYVLGIEVKDLKRFREICERERCPFAVVGETTKEKNLVLHDGHFKKDVINLPMSVLFGESSKMTREFATTQTSLRPLDLSSVKITDAVKRVMHLPAVASKKFLITIGDRTVGGLCVRDQMVGPWQVPVSDVAVSSASFDGVKGEAVAMGERTPLAVINAPASARMAIGETITNMAAASIKNISDIKLSANWMAAAGYANEDEKLYKTVKTVGEDFCPSLGITIPVGKDSLSMRTSWQEGGIEKAVTSPVSLIVSGFSPVQDITKTQTPELNKNIDSALIYIDLGQGSNRLGGSALAQVYNQVGDTAPDADPNILKSFFRCIQNLNKENKILAYHDRSDGGLFTTLCEMAFTARCGIDIDLEKLPGKSLGKLFNEELGAVIQVNSKDGASIRRELEKELGKCIYIIGTIAKDQNISIHDNNKLLYKNTRAELESWWSETSYVVQSLRDNPDSAKQEFSFINKEDDPGLSPVINFDFKIKRNYESRPKVAILREQGVNGQVEMAAAFHRAGFTCVDVHLNDLMRGTANLNDFVGLAACGGFSYGDVLGAGEGWAKSILFNSELRLSFKNYFERKDTFSLGVCNGCQMLANLKELIPGAESWPKFLKNSSEQFEARLVSVIIEKSPSIFLKGMEGSVIPIAVAHGEGRAEFGGSTADNKLVGMRYVDNFGKVSNQYPFNPNGSPNGITGLTTSDGRATILMPHPERVFLTKQLSWHPEGWGVNSPWFKIFQNARDWVEHNS